MNYEHYDIFISFKRQNSDGTLTRDSELALFVYKTLSGMGYSVFMSDESLKKEGTSEYTHIITRALESASVLVAVATSAHNLEAEWIKFEWESFFNEIVSKRKPWGEIFVYIDGFDIDELHYTLRQRQTIKHGKGSLELLTKFVSNALQNGPSKNQHLTALIKDLPNTIRSDEKNKRDDAIEKLKNRVSVYRLLRYVVISAFIVGLLFIGLRYIINRYQLPGPVTEKIYSKDFRSGKKQSGVGKNFSTWYELCSGELPEGAVIKSSIFRLEGDRSCGSWAECEQTVDTTSQVCWKFRLQGYEEKWLDSRANSEGILTVNYSLPPSLFPTFQ